MMSFLFNICLDGGFSRFDTRYEGTKQHGAHWEERWSAWGSLSREWKNGLTLSVSLTWQEHTDIATDSIRDKMVSQAALSWRF
jgi:hypothetical protein